MNSVGRYSAVLGRSPFIERHSVVTPEISAYGFPPLPKSFWRSLFSEGHTNTIYLTAGMSSHLMPVPYSEQQIYPTKIELMAVCDGQILGGPNGNEDIVSSMLLAVANDVISTNKFIGVGHTLDFQEQLAGNTSMSALLFTPPEGIDEKRLCQCTTAKAILNIVPITASELAFTRQAGVEKLIDLFETAKVRPIFDFLRSSVV